MKVFEIDPGGYQRHFVVADTFAEAEKLHTERYVTRPKRIDVLGDDVLVKGIDDVESEKVKYYQEHLEVPMATGGIILPNGSNNTTPHLESHWEDGSRIKVKEVKTL